VNEINKMSDFTQDEIYEQKMVGNKPFSWNSFRILGPMVHEHRYTISVRKPNQDISWALAKIVAVLGSAFVKDTDLAYGFYNLFFAESTSTESLLVYAQVSMTDYQ